MTWRIKIFEKIVIDEKEELEFIVNYFKEKGIEVVEDDVREMLYAQFLYMEKIKIIKRKD